MQPFKSILSTTSCKDVTLLTNPTFCFFSSVPHYLRVPPPFVRRPRPGKRKISWSPLGTAELNTRGSGRIRLERTRERRTRLGFERTNLPLSLFLSLLRFFVPKIVSSSSEKEPVVEEGGKWRWPPLSCPAAACSSSSSSCSSSRSPTRSLAHLFCPPPIHKSRRPTSAQNWLNYCWIFPLIRGYDYKKAYTLHFVFYIRYNTIDI